MRTTALKGASTNSTIQFPSTFQKANKNTRTHKNGDSINIQHRLFCSQKEKENV
jgi:hypothetical protein